jgi:hypothetical protein
MLLSKWIDLENIVFGARETSTEKAPASCMESYVENQERRGSEYCQSREPKLSFTHEIPRQVL